LGLGDFMDSGSETKDFSEKSRIVMEYEEIGKRAIRTVFGIILVVVSGIMMVSGIKVIGQSQHFGGGYYLGGTYTYWHPAQFEWGIFFTLVGTLAVAFSFMLLVSTWKRKGV
jgi:ABC-type phosphate transport system permease subunit